ncbi:hypothetical protein BHE74_00028769 [Ensete ventricosum]|nr:hypothetical protein BHE74_00028769 [Ensete ventricosum]RZR97608.1 hypothetical protein BHM03_00026843 [Ensete ventricosum]
MRWSLSELFLLLFASSYRRLPRIMTTARSQPSGSPRTGANSPQRGTAISQLSAILPRASPAVLLRKDRLNHVTDLNVRPFDRDGTVDLRVLGTATGGLATVQLRPPKETRKPMLDGIW